MAPKGAPSKSASPKRNRSSSAKRQGQRTGGGFDDPAKGVSSSSTTVALPRDLAQRSVWEPSVVQEGSALALQQPPLDGAQDVTALVSSLSRGAETAAALSSLCAELTRGGNPASEAACDSGGIQAVLALLGSGGGCADMALARGATEALYWLAGDYDQTQLLIDAGGHDCLLRMTREAAPQDAVLAVNSFRLLANTLYCEGRGAKLWRECDLGFVVDALGWVLGAGGTEPSGAEGAVLLASVCDVAALWLQRRQQATAGSAAAPAEDVARAMVGIIPLILQRLAERSDDMVVLTQGCRLLWVLAKACECWPANVREPALAALQQLQGLFMFSPNFEVRSYGGLAMEAVASLPSQSSGDLTAMD